MLTQSSASCARSGGHTGLEIQQSLGGGCRWRAFDGHAVSRRSALRRDKSPAIYCIFTFEEKEKVPKEKEQEECLLS